METDFAEQAARTYSHRISKFFKEFFQEYANLKNLILMSAFLQTDSLDTLLCHFYTCYTGVFVNKVSY